jgi:hypothetical protein
MGEFLNMVLIVLGISVVGGLVSMGFSGLASDSGQTTIPIFLGDYLFGTGQTTNPLTMDIHGTGSLMTYNYINESNLPQQSTTGSSASNSGFVFPDWLNSAYNFVKGSVNSVSSSTRVIVNILGFPYTLMVAMHLPTQISALVGGAFAIIFFLLIVMFILGRVS